MFREAHQPTRLKHVSREFFFKGIIVFSHSQMIQTKQEMTPISIGGQEAPIYLLGVLFK
jgi:hypothetical protein